MTIQKIIKVENLVENDADCIKLLNKPIISSGENYHFKYSTLKNILDTNDDRMYLYWINTVLNKKINVDVHTEEEIKDYLKLKWLQVTLISYLIDNYLMKFEIDFTKLPQYNTYASSVNLPPKDTFIAESVYQNFVCSEMNDFAIYNVRGRVGFDKNALIIVEFEIPLQISDLAIRSKYNNFTDFCNNSVNGFEFIAHVIENNRDTADFAKLPGGFARFDQPILKKINDAIINSIEWNIIYNN